MRLDRVAEDIFILVSDLYAQVTSTVLLTRAGAIVVDTLPFPNETRQIIAFVENKLGPNSVRYVINTHSHADHTYGNCFFDGVQVIAQEQGRTLLERHGAAILDRAKRETPALAEVELRLPDLTFGAEMYLHLEHRHLQLLHTPGHSPDGISVFVTDERVLIAGDAVMPVPHITQGNRTQLAASLQRILDLKPNFVVQGHGDVLLRGEIDESMESSIAYLAQIEARVRRLIQRGEPPARLRDIAIEDCGKSRIPLDGLVGRLHLDNLITLYRDLRKEMNGQ